MSTTVQLLLLTAGIVLGLGTCLWMARAVLREMAKGWALDEQRRPSNWERGQENLGTPPAPPPTTPNARANDPAQPTR